MKNVFLYAHGGSGNHGCEAIVRSTLGILQCKDRPNCTLISKVPEEDAKYGIDQLCTIIQEQEPYSRLTLDFAKAYLHLKITHDYVPLDKLYYKNVSGLIIAKIGDYLVNSTDNLIITKLVSLAATGIYSNYLLIRNMINGFIATLFNGITASMGNVVAVENDEKKLEIFDAVFFCAFLIYSIEATCFMSLYNLFIGDIWIGRNYIFSVGTVAVIVLNNYLTGLRIPLITMKGAAGKYLEDTWIPFGFAIVNLVASILLAKPFGVAGVFLGTIIGSLFTADWYRPFVIYRTVFHAPVKKYFRKYMVYLLLGVGYIALTYWLNAQIHLSNAYLLFLVRGIVSVSVPILLSCALFYRTTEFDAIKTLTIRLVRGTAARLHSRREDSNG